MTSDRGHERYDVEGADILFRDTWAEEAGDTCPGCAATLPAGAVTCPSCGAPVAVCTGSCSSCGAPRCVGRKRTRR